MDKIRVPSPSTILHPVPAASSAGRSRAPVSTQNAAPVQTATAVTTNKPKQSKSRNGCITCKAKRLKCDESKPTCLQCKKRTVECGGYKKDFKWRSFGEANVPGRSTTPRTKKGSTSPSSGKSTVHSSSPVDTQPRRLETTHSLHSRQSSPRDILSRRPSQSSEKKDLAFSFDQLFNFSASGSFNDDAFVPSLTDLTPSEQSPWLSNVLPPPDTSNPSSFSDTFLDGYQRNDDFSFEALLEGDDDGIEEIIRQPDRGMASRAVSFSGQFDSHPSGPNILAPSLLREPVFSLANPEMLVAHFDRSTCGILSVKDGIHENPWRTLVWPLAKTTPALYHAVFALAAFHASKDNPSLRVHGVDHMRKSITCMVEDIQSMRTDAALATSLSLAFADTWDQHTRSCIQHLRGAKALVSQVVESGLQGAIHGAQLSRVRFLYNTWLYMDVIARLTSREDHGGQGLVIPAFQFPENTVHQIDPLMGCAATLFPIIDQVARLIQKVRKTESNSVSLISQAIELKQLVEQWEPPDWFEPPEDPTSEVQHSIQTAHAYRWATLLYLHQAVPEMPSEPTSDLAKRVLILLATVPPSSRTLIIQMFPLLVAGCEAEQEEDRNWVLNRWSAIQCRLMLGSIDRCIEVVREVWARRDASEARKQQEQLRRAGRSNHSTGQISGKDRAFYTGRGSIPSSRRSSAVSPLENIEYDRTVRGRSHWVHVMQEWNWEVFLG
ncbi:fungal-specific transcription factor domain-containing protein [Aspergillus pseudodeflectus]|uniref:Fungal-specific transcription factor domain-containing protein n=1 Tax=Aspergillus pseudodeflectus TaxID=176178 RepID=A0ABR4K1K8_9EURO